MKLNVLSDADIAVLKILVEAQKKGLKNGRAFGEKNWSPEDDQNTPEVYVALPPTTGIPALTMMGDVPAEDDEPGEAECEIYQLIDDGTNPPQLKLMDMADKTVYNLSTTAISGDTVWILIFRLKTGGWVAAPNGSSAALHCKVTSCAGKGYYRGTIGSNPSFVWPSPEGTGTGTADIADATGTGTSDSSCDPCIDIIGETQIGDTTASCGTLQEPYRISPGETTTTVYIYDPRAIPLKTPGHAIIMHCGDYIDDPDYEDTDTGTGTGTGTSIPQVKLYMVLSGTYEVVGIPDRFYKCCDGASFLYKCDTYIVEGAYCPGVELDCPTTGTASGT